MSNLRRFIRILDSLKTESYGPDGLWTLNYDHVNNTWFFKGFVFDYTYTGVMPNNTVCLEVIRHQMITELEELGEDKFNEGGWALAFTVNPPGAGELQVRFKVSGGPGSEPPNT